MTQVTHERVTLTSGNLNSHFAEAFRTLRANIGFSSVDQPTRSILVTSAAPREGKTMTVLNLGIIMAHAGPRVLIVDADFRHPSLHHLARFSPNGHKSLPGLSNVLVGGVSLDEAIVPTGFANLSLFPAGSVPPNPSELLASKRMHAVIAELKERADFILLDSPPCILYSDAAVLAGAVDGVLYVLRAGRQEKAAQRRVQKHLQQAKARILGVVFNDVEVEEAGVAYTYYYPTPDKHR